MGDDFLDEILERTGVLGSFITAQVPQWEHTINAMPRWEQTMGAMPQWDNNYIDNPFTQQPMGFEVGLPDPVGFQLGGDPYGLGSTLGSLWAAPGQALAEQKRKKEQGQPSPSGQPSARGVRDPGNLDVVTNAHFQVAKESALKWEKITGVPAPYTLAIWAHESGWGKSGLARTNNNFFGIKDFDDPSGYRRFKDLDDSIGYMTRMISDSPRYRDAFIANKHDPQALMRAIVNAGYVEPGNRENYINLVTPLLESMMGPAPVITPGGQPVPKQTSSLSVGPAPTVGVPRASQYKTTFDWRQTYSGNTDPSLRGKPHRGVDMILPGPNNGRGTPVGAFESGTVVYQKPDPLGGNGIWIQDAQGLVHRYYHFDQVYVRMGDTVRRGQPIGTLGASGLDGPVDGGPHLHYEVTRGAYNGAPDIDPRPWVKD